MARGAFLLATDISELSIEELTELEVMSVSRHETKLSKSPAAVAVLTGEDVRRLGATSLPEALRAVPGMNVARLSGNKWAVSARGFNDEYANKLLVMIDGRSVYTPSIGGVYWNQNDLLLEDLEQIEVVRGPGGALWGANAMNGVVNIITKSAKETQGLLATTTVGTESQPEVGVRYGGRISSNAFYRVYTKYFRREGFEDTSGRSMNDDWHMARGGLRLDWEPSEENKFMLTGEYFTGHYGEQVSKQSLDPEAFLLSDVKVPTGGGSILARWTRIFSDTSELQLQAYYDNYYLSHAFGGATLEPVADLDAFARRGNRMTETRHTWDVDLQHQFAFGPRQHIVWGAGYRYTMDDFGMNGSSVWLRPSADEIQLFNVFAQDEVTLVEDRLKLTLGAKFEHTPITGWQTQPGARLLWTPTERQTVWASVARAVRTPTRLERALNANLAVFALEDETPGIVTLSGNNRLHSEKMMAYEIGYRVEPTRRVLVDVAGFYNEYRDLIAVKNSGMDFIDPPGYVENSLSYRGDPFGRTYGAELLVRWLPTDFWRLTAGYSWLQASAREDALLDTLNPQHQFHLHSSLELRPGWELDTAVYYVDTLTFSSSAPIQTKVPAYTRLDLGLTWRPSRRLTVAFWAQNLLGEAHPEAPGLKTPNITEISRTFYGKATWTF